MPPARGDRPVADRAVHGSGHDGLDPEMAKGRKDEGWAEAKRLCRLSADDIAKAKALGMSPKSLIKNIPSKSQQWKTPVREWILDLYETKFGDRPVRPPSKPATDLSPTERPVQAGPGPFDEGVDPDPKPMVGVGDEALREADRTILRKRRDWVKAAKFVAWEFRKLAWVERIVLFGSLAAAPTDPPFSGKPRIWPGATLHDPTDVDLAVWVSSLDDPRSLQKARSRALNRLLEKTQIGVAHHQVDVFLMEPGTDRYLGRLCLFRTCPFEGKSECLAHECGAHPFLQQLEGFELRPGALAGEKVKVLFDRRTAAAERHHS